MVEARDYLGVRQSGLLLPFLALLAVQVAIGLML